LKGASACLRGHYYGYPMTQGSRLLFWVMVASRWPASIASGYRCRQMAICSIAMRSLAALTEQNL
jgi:hypothetical protein